MAARSPADRVRGFAEGITITPAARAVPMTAHRILRVARCLSTELNCRRKTLPPTEPNSPISFTVGLVALNDPIPFIPRHVMETGSLSFLSGPLEVSGTRCPKGASNSPRTFKAMGHVFVGCFHHSFRPPLSLLPPPPPSQHGFPRPVIP